jgi:hypothetical protein
MLLQHRRRLRLRPRQQLHQHRQLRQLQPLLHPHLLLLHPHLPLPLLLQLRPHLPPLLLGLLQRYTCYFTLIN